MPDPIQYSSALVDLTNRFKRSTVIVASPALAAETVVASLTIADDLVVAQGVRLEGWLSLTVGTTGANLRLRLRQTGVAGTLVADTGALTGGIAAANLVAQDIMGFDTAPVLPGQVYVLTAQVGSATAASTLSAVFLGAIIV